MITDYFNLFIASYQPTNVKLHVSESELPCKIGLL